MSGHARDFPKNLHMHIGILVQGCEKSPLELNFLKTILNISGDIKRTKTELHNKNYQNL